MCFTLSFLILIFGCYGKSAIGTFSIIYADKVSYALTKVGLVTLSPMGMAPVCRIGDPLQITCMASVQFIRWSIVVVNEQGMEEEMTVSRNSRDSSPPPSERIINSTMFTFTRTSAEDVLPLISTLAINSTSIGLNGTVVHCRDVSNAMISASTTIQIIDTSTSKLAISGTITIIII